jgi:YegS/Rv2252/BmrU family lipid kinase
VVAQKPVVIVNPRSGGGLSDKSWAALVGPLTDGLGPFDVRFTERGGDGRRIAHEEATAGRALVVAFGGDGTISEVADGVMAAGAAAEMGVIPRGTGGDFRRSVDLPYDLADAARHVRERQPRAIDVGRASFVGHDGAPVIRHFVNIASFGFSAEAATRANASSKRFGAKLAFVGAAARTLMAFDGVEVLISVDGGEPQRRTVLLGAIGNGRFFGGGMKICPEGLLDDGMFELVVVGEMGRLSFMGKFNRIWEGNHLTLKEVNAVRARRVEVTPVDPAAAVAIELDGETPGRLPATFELLPAALKLRF